MADRTDGKAPCALVVEDEFLVALHVEDILQEIGFDVVGPVARVTDALRLIEQERKLDFAVLDVNLNGEMSWPVARALRARSVPFVFVTGYIEAHAAVPDDLSGERILPKPLDTHQLASVVNAKLRSLT
jgi:two-component SAPR family response regulator